MNRVKEFYAFRTESKNSQEILRQYFNKSIPSDGVANFEKKNLIISNFEFISVNIKEEVTDTVNYNDNITANSNANENTTSLFLKIEKFDMNSLKLADGEVIIEGELQKNGILHENIKITNQNINVNEKNLIDYENRSITTSQLSLDDFDDGIMDIYQQKEENLGNSIHRFQELDYNQVVLKNKKGVGIFNFIILFYVLYFEMQNL